MTTVAALADRPHFARLTPRQQAFIMHPDVNSLPVKAAIEVGYSETYAEARAHQLRKELLYYIMPVTEHRLEGLGVTVERIRNELAAIAFANVVDYYDVVDVQGQTVKMLKDFHLLPEAMQRAIKSVEFEEIVDTEGKTYQSVKKLELHDKRWALGDLEEIMGLRDAKMRQPKGDLQEEDAELLENLDDAELLIVQRLYQKAADRATKLTDKRRDKSAIPGKSEKAKE